MQEKMRICEKDKINKLKDIHWIKIIIIKINSSWIDTLNNKY